MQRGLITVGGVPQKNHAQHRHGIFGGREVGVGSELIGGIPQAGFNLRDVVEGVGGHLRGGDCCFWRVAERRLGWVASGGVNDYAQLWLGVGVGLGGLWGLRVKVFCS